mgnify:CR=1 FL=1|jgi:hypothetical protein
MRLFEGRWCSRRRRRTFVFMVEVGVGDRSVVSLATRGKKYLAGGLVELTTRLDVDGLTRGSYLAGD